MKIRCKTVVRMNRALNEMCRALHSCLVKPSKRQLVQLAIRPGGARKSKAPETTRTTKAMAMRTEVNARHWKREGNRVTMEVTIPANSTATIYVPARAAGEVTVDGRALTKADHVTFLRMKKKSAVIEVGAGSYEFKSTRRQDEPDKALKTTR